MSLDWSQHLFIRPVLLPLLCGARLILINERRHHFKFAVSLSSLLMQFAVAIALIGLSDGSHWANNLGIYLAANWTAPFGIALLVDRLSALMLLLTALQIGRASCRERVCQSVSISVVAVSLKKK